MKYGSMTLMLLLITVLPVSADKPVLHAMDATYVGRYLLEGTYLLHIDARDMEEALAQVIPFFESLGLGINRKQPQYSGIPLIYEYNEISEKYLPIRDKIRQDALHKTVEYLCNKTRGAFRSSIYEGRILVVRKQVDSLLYNLKIRPMRMTDISIYEAFQKVLEMANNSARDVRIRLEKPNSILMRDGVGPAHWLMYNQLPASILNEKISVNIRSNTLLDGLTQVMRMQPYPFYLSLKPDTPRSQYTHVLRFDTLPEARIRGLEPTYGGRIPPYPTR
ncbi:MAG: hypothetical protein ACOX5R_22590 [bacterium]|jgi:hypothetical protein